MLESTTVIALSLYALNRVNPREAFASDPYESRRGARL
jgi:hypothetical protein